MIFPENRTNITEGLGDLHAGSLNNILASIAHQQGNSDASNAGVQSLDDSITPGAQNGSDTQDNSQDDSNDQQIQPPASQNNWTDLFPDDV